MAEQFYTILTAVGKAKIANAAALGKKIELTELALGDGGGSYYNPTEDQTELRNEVWRGAIGKVDVDEENPNWIIIQTVVPSQHGGFMIREAGVFDNEGDLIAVGKYPETYKPAMTDGSIKDLVVRMILEVSNTASVVLKVDSTVFATQRQVEEAEARAKAYTDQEVAEVSQALDAHKTAAAPHSGHETPAGAQAKVDAHESKTSTHGATSAATANRIIIRDSAGRAKVAAPSAPDDIARKAEVDAAQTAAQTYADQQVSAHANRTDNPHSVTKSQVGLGNVENYGVATQAEAEAGSVNNKYMTPLRVAQAIAALHANRRDNPHNVTAEQVGAPTQEAFDAHVANTNNLIGTLQHQAAILKPEDGKLWHFDTSLESTDGIKPLEGAVATLRPNEGRFGGAVAVEEETTNLVPSDRLKFEGWTAFSDAQVTLTQNVEFPEIGRNDATRIRTTGGTDNLKYYRNIEMSIVGQAYTGSVYIKNIGSKPVRFRTQLGSDVTVNPGEWTRAIVSGIGSGTLQFQLRFEALNVDDDLDFIAWGPQAEHKLFATSFVDGTRANGNLRYYDEPAGGNDYTIALWAKTHTNDPSAYQVLFDGRDARSRSMLAFSTSGVLAMIYRDSSGNNRNRSTGFSMGDRTEWHHYVLTFTGPRSSGTFRVFVDGQLVYTYEDSLQLPGTSGMYIGRGIPTNEIWNGLIDELLILPYAATDAEIKGWYEAKKPFIDQDEINTIDQEVKDVRDIINQEVQDVRNIINQEVQDVRNIINQEVQDVRNTLDNHAETRATLNELGHLNHAVLTTTIDTNWQGSAPPYTKTQTVNGLLATDTPIVDVVMSGNFATDEARIEAWGYVYRITTADNAITLYATEKPTVSLPIQLKVVR